VVRNKLVRLPTLTLPIVLCGILATRYRAHFVFFVASAIVAGLFMLGSQGPVFPAYYSLPLGNLFRLPTRMVFLYLFLVAGLIAIGIDGVKGRLRSHRFRNRTVVVATAILGLLVCADAYTRTRLNDTHPVMKSSRSGGPKKLIELLRDVPRRERVFVQDLSRSFGVASKVGMMNRAFVVPDYEPTMPVAYAKYFDREVPPPWPGSLSLLAGKSFRPASELVKFLDLMSVRYYAVVAPPGSTHVDDIEALLGAPPSSAGNLHWFERPQALPRAYAVRAVVYKPDLESALERIARDPFRPGEEAVVIDANPPLLTWGDASSPQRADTAGIASYTSAQVEIDAECASRCLLVLTDFHYPGWRVYVDGTEQRIERANGIFRGVRLEAGRHRVVYRYRPSSLRLGLVILLGSLLVFAASGIYLGRGTRRSRHIENVSATR
jgi:hypothetical protein